MLILIAHGSRDPGWRASLEALTERVRESSQGEDVRLAYMQFDGPSLPEVLHEAWERGERSFRLLPLFMASAGHVDKDIRPMVRELSHRIPGGTIEMLSPIGEDPAFHALIVRIANQDRT